MKSFQQPFEANGFGLFLKRRSAGSSHVTAKDISTRSNTKTSDEDAPEAQESQIKIKDGKSDTAQQLEENRPRFKRQSAQKLGFETLKVAAFNIQTFGVRKMTSYPIVATTLVRVGEQNWTIILSSVFFSL